MNNEDLTEVKEEVKEEVKRKKKVQFKQEHQFFVFSKSSDNLCRLEKNATKPCDQNTRNTEYLEKKIVSVTTTGFITEDVQTNLIGDPDFNYNQAIATDEILQIDGELIIPKENLDVSDENLDESQSSNVSDSHSINAENGSDVSQEQENKSVDLNVKFSEAVQELRLLDRCKFDRYLMILKRKKDKFERIYGEKEKEDYQIALESIEDLQERLYKAKFEFLNSKECMYLKVRALRGSCLDAVDEARQTLKEHRGWKKFFAKFVSVLLSVSSLFLANLISGRGVFGLFHPKTNSAKKLDKLAFDLKVATHDVLESTKSLM